MTKLVAAALTSLICATSFAQASVDISARPTSNMTCSGGVCSPTAANAVLNVTDLAGMLADGDVNVVSDSVAKDIRINAALSWTSTSRLTFTSYHSIEFNKPVVVGGTGALTITTNAGGKNGDFDFHGKGHIEISDSHSNLIINGKNYVLVKDVSAFRSEIRRGGGGLGTYYALQMSGPAGKYKQSPIDETFEGTFEGLGNKLLRLRIISTEGAGFFGQIGGTVRDLTLSDVDVEGVGFAGSLAGGNIGNVINCFASGQVSGNGDGSIIGGLIGLNFGPISHSGATASVSGTGTGVAVGGLTGENMGFDRGGIGYILQSYATGAVTGGDGAMVGGLTGMNYSAAVEDSYATGSATGGSGAFVGGLIGSHGATTFSPVLRRSYSTGAVTGGSDATVGGLIGQDLAQSRTTHAYWDIDTSGVSDPANGAGNVQNDSGITGLTTVQFQSGLPHGFGKQIWSQKATINGGYPYLADNPPG